MPKSNRRVDSAAELREELERPSRDGSSYSLIVGGDSPDRSYLIIETYSYKPEACYVIGSYKTFEIAAHTLRILASVFPDEGIYIGG